MPRKQIDPNRSLPDPILSVSEGWLARYEATIPHAIDSLTGWEHQIQMSIVNGEPEPEDLLETLRSQIIDLRRSLESLRLIF